MEEFALAAGASVVAALVMAALVAFVRRSRREIRRINPVDVELLRIVREPWSVAFSGSVPDTAAMDGRGVPTREVYDAFIDAGAADFAESKIKLTVRNKGNEPIAIRDVRVVCERTLPYSGSRVFCEGGGANAATLLVFDLDEDRPQAREWEEDGARALVSSDPYFDTHHISLDPGCLHDFVIIGRADSHFIRWSLELDVQSGAKLITTRVDDGGRPLQTTGQPKGGFLTELDWAWWEGGRLIPLGSGVEDIV